jgi:hypothetical protein
VPAATRSGWRVLTASRDVMMSAPRELCGGLAFITAPAAPFVPEAMRGRPAVATIVLWAGPQSEGSAGLAPLAAPGEPAVDRVGPISYAELQQTMDPGATSGHRDYVKGGFMSQMSGVSPRSSSSSAIRVLSS